jgi:serine/threonine protein phosphatase 1
MRILAIGDIHGCSKALDLLLAEVKLTAADQLVTLGDYVDRGPDSCGVLDRLIRLQKVCQVVSLRGNHEIMMVQARDQFGQLRPWLSCGGRETLQSYGGDSIEPSLDDVPDAHWEFIENTCRDWYETERHFFVHANAYPDVPLAEQPDYMLQWEKLAETRPHCSGKVMVCGHTPQKSGLPLNRGHVICLDTGVYRGGWLTCLDVVGGRFWQANQKGEKRTSMIDLFQE